MKKPHFEWELDRFKAWPLALCSRYELERGASS